jgi:hypothetical protein
MSMVELLIATLLFFLIVMGLLPLFARSAVSNAMGSDMTQLSNHAKTQAEVLYQVPFNGISMDVPDGETELLTTEIWDETRRAFVAGVPPSGGPAPRWARTTRVRQYSLPEFGQEVLDPATDALDGSAPPENVQLKEVEVIVESYPNLAEPDRPGSGLLPGRRIVVRTLKPF